MCKVCVCVCMCVLRGKLHRSIGLSVYRFIGISVYRFIGVSVYRFIGLSVYRFIGLSMYRFIGLSVYRFIGLSAYWFIGFIGLSVYRAIGLLVYRFISLSVYRFICLSVYRFIGLSSSKSDVRGFNGRSRPSGVSVYLLYWLRLLARERYLPPRLGPHAEVTDDAAHLRNGALQILPGALYERRQLLQSLLLGLCGIPSSTLINLDQFL